MKVNDGLRYLDETNSISNLSSFMIFGGEAMLYPDRTIKLFERAQELEIPSIQLITNGFWGRDSTKARTWAERLKEAGVNDILVSVDAFHLPHIPVDWPREAASACLDAGIHRVRWNVAVLEGLDAGNPYDLETKRILDSLSNLDVQASLNDIWPRGRAVENLARYLPKRPMGGRCPEANPTGNIVKPQEIGIGPYSWVNICWNLSIGNAKTCSIPDMLANYDYNESTVLDVLVNHGPIGLLDLPEAHGFDFKQEAFIDRCQLCIELRKFMRDIHPDAYTENGDT
jgi:hypothetical protein